MYRDWAWELVIALETYCKTANGYTGIKDVSNTKRTTENSDDIQHSYFLSATLKYLYLIFSDENFYSFSDYVFNSDAHPILINKVF
jgi:mannosyl-oligosaccharide alpha-1,2-mannosidase